MKNVGNYFILMASKYINKVKKMTVQDFKEVEERLVFIGIYTSMERMEIDEALYIMYSLLNGLFLDGSEVNFNYYDAMRILNYID